MTNLNGNGKKSRSPWPPEQLRLLTGDLPFDEDAELQLAFDTCQALDDDALETLAGLDLDTEALAAVEQLAYSAAIRRHYVARLRNLRRRLDAGDEGTVMRFVFRKPARGLRPWAESE